MLISSEETYLKPFVAYTVVSYELTRKLLGYLKDVDVNIKFSMGKSAFTEPSISIILPKEDTSARKFATRFEEKYSVYVNEFLKSVREDILNMVAKNIMVLYTYNFSDSKKERIDLSMDILPKFDEEETLDVNIDIKLRKNNKS